jgi:xanthine/CO dehydrogenase XdhC/CoxF family maturation factor
MASGEGQQLTFGVTNEMAWEVGLACGGKVAIWVERVS